MSVASRKRPRTTTQEGAAFGLFDLFGSRRPTQDSTGCPKREPQELESRDYSEEPFFTFRMEHRQGGTLAKHFGEERILLFRSDQRGAVAKIIFSSNPSEIETDGEIRVDGEAKEEADLQRLAQAKIHVLSVKDFYRGYDIGGLLFSEAMASLRHRYHHETSIQAATQEESAAIPENLRFSVRCQLDAEEDVRRHNKLVYFYEHLGCHVKPKAKISYINNNDRETYRKVPMQIELRDFDHSNEQHRPLINFLPVLFFSAHHECAGLLNNPNRLDWLVVETTEGFLEFRSTNGLVLAAESDGCCTAKVGCEKDRSKFQLLRVSDVQAKVLERKLGEEAVVSKEARQKELWIIKSRNEQFLGLDSTGRFLVCTQEPAFWQAGDHDLSLTCTRDSPARRQHYRYLWSTQTVDYVRDKRARYLQFSICQMSLKNAIDQVREIPGDRFYKGGATPSLRSLLYYTAELARGEGFPDWFQLIALLHGLGSVLNLVDQETATEAEQECYDWTICTHSRILGCKAPQNSTLSEFRCLNPDEADERYSSETGVYDAHCGLENVMLLWIGSEYMHGMLKHNEVELPDEAFAVLRLFALKDWHTKQYHKILANENDIDSLPFVKDFNDLRQDARKIMYASAELTDNECDALWNSYYARIAKKYGADGALNF